MLPLPNFEKHITPRKAASSSTKFQLHTTTKLAQNNYLQDLSLKTSLPTRKLHVKNLSMQNHESFILVSYPYEFTLFIFLA
jgi:hypothetical protein